MKSELLNEKIKCSYIRKHPLFNKLSEDHFAGICSKARLVKLRKNNPFFLNADPLSRIYFLADGTAKLVSFDCPGHHSVRDILADGDIFGDFVFSGSNLDGYVTGLRPNTHIFYFIADEFKKILQQDHLLSLNYAHSMGHKLRLLEERHSIWTNKDARQRLLYFFQGWTACAGTRIDNRVILDNYFAMSDIAEFIGVSRQFMHIMLRELKEEDLVHYSRKQISVSELFLEQNASKQKKVI